MNLASLHIRPGTRADIPRAFELICELAAFENARDKVKTSPAQLERDGFGEAPLFHFLVAELDGEIVGMALCYFRYSTWSGKQLYLEDLIVGARGWRREGVIRSDRRKCARSRLYGANVAGSRLEYARARLLREVRCPLRWRVAQRAF